MKKLTTCVSMLFIAMVISMPLAKAQKAPFTGTVVYDVKAEGEIPEEAKAMMPTEMTLKITPEKQSMSMNFGMMEQKTISDAATQESNSLMNVMGQKLNLKVTAAQIKEQRLQQGETSGVKLTDETKTIAGFACKKAVITKKMNGADATMDVYYTDDIDVSKFAFSNSVPEVKGLPMEFILKSGPMSFKMSARTVKNENIAATEFAIPADYKVVTTEELRTMFGGGGQ